MKMGSIRLRGQVRGSVSLKAQLPILRLIPDRGSGHILPELLPLPPLPLFLGLAAVLRRGWDLCRNIVRPPQAGGQLNRTTGMVCLGRW